MHRDKQCTPPYCKDLGHLKLGLKVHVVVHVHAKAGTNVRANERKDEMKDMKTGGHERKEENRSV